MRLKNKTQEYNQREIQNKNATVFRKNLQTAFQRNTIFCLKQDSPESIFSK